MCKYTISIPTFPYFFRIFKTILEFLNFLKFWDIRGGCIFETVTDTNIQPPRISSDIIRDGLKKITAMDMFLIRGGFEFVTATDISEDIRGGLKKVTATDMFLIRSGFEYVTATDISDISVAV